MVFVPSGTNHFCGRPAVHLLKAVNFAAPRQVTTTASVAGAAGGALLSVTFSPVALGVQATDTRKTLYLVNVKCVSSSVSGVCCGAAQNLLRICSPPSAIRVAGRMPCWTGRGRTRRRQGRTPKLP